VVEYRYTYRNGKRFYKIQDKEYVGVTSVTSLISPFKNSKPGPAAHIGSLAHFHILKNYSSEPLDQPRDMIWIPEHEVRAKIQNAIKMWKDLDLQWTFKDIETMILNHEYGYAGRTDFTGFDEEGEFFVGDIKTGAIYPDYDLQLAAYCKAVGAKRYYLVQLDLNDKEDRNPNQIGKIIRKEEEDIDKSFDEFLVLLNRFKVENNI
jgi:hypothetical protein